MDVLTLAMWIGTAILLIFSFAKDKGKTKQALKMAFGMGKGMLGSILSIIFLIGLILTVFPPENIAEFVGKQSVLLATVIAAAFGAITLIPAFIDFFSSKSQVSSGPSCCLPGLPDVCVESFPCLSPRARSRCAMLITLLQALAPIALLIALGAGLRRRAVLSDAFWPQAERLS